MRSDSYPHDLTDERAAQQVAGAVKPRRCAQRPSAPLLASGVRSTATRWADIWTFRTMSDRKEWCVYTGRWHPVLEMTDDHVIPLSIGGHDSLVVRASKPGNELMNRLLDEKVRANPLIAYMTKLGHSTRRRRRVAPVRWKATVGGVAGRVNLSTPRFEFETHRSDQKFSLNNSRELRGETFTAQLQIDVNMMLSFACRLALGAALYLFGDAFREFGYHERLRALATSPTSVDDLRFQMVNHVEPGAFWAFPWPYSTRDFNPRWYALTRSTKGHLMFTQRARNETILGISLFGGVFDWTFNLSNHPERFPVGGPELGTVVEINEKGQFARSTLLSYLVDRNITAPNRAAKRSSPTT